MNTLLSTIDEQLVSMRPAVPTNSAGCEPPSEPTPAMVAKQVFTTPCASPEMNPVCADDWPGTGTLAERFDISRCRFPSEEEIRQLCSWVVVLTEDMEHIMHCAPLEFYLMDNLRERDHSFENKTPLSDPQTGSRLQVNYPQTMDYFSEVLSVVRGGNDLYGKHFGSIWVCLPMLFRFVLQFGECNGKRDGSVAIDAGQRRRITFGCAGQAYAKLADGTSAPKQTYGFDIFDKVEDENDRASIRQMLADILDAMQDAKDEIEVMKLKNRKPFYLEKRTNLYGKALRDAIGAERFRREDVTLQVKCLSKAERTALTHR